MKRQADTPKKIKNPTRQKIIVEQGRSMMGDFIPYKILHIEVVESADKVKERIKELREEYKDTEALSICHFSL